MINKAVKLFSINNRWSCVFNQALSISLLLYLAILCSKQLMNVQQQNLSYKWVSNQVGYNQPALLHILNLRLEISSAKLQDIFIWLTIKDLLLISYATSLWWFVSHGFGYNTDQCWTPYDHLELMYLLRIGWLTQKKKKTEKNNRKVFSLPRVHQLALLRYA